MPLKTSSREADKVVDKAEAEAEAEEGVIVHVFYEHCVFFYSGPHIQAISSVYLYMLA
jgi:hypothetical protein